jgi:mevalonate kinase
MHHKGYGSAHAKVILLGEHAVVYGHPGIAIPFHPLYAKAVVEVDPKEFIISSLFVGEWRKMPTGLSFLKNLIQRLYDHLEIKHVTIHLSNDIPTSAGLGSSAAIASAIIEAFFDFAQVTLTPEIRFQWIQSSEKEVHGNPSGIDAFMVNADHIYQFAKAKVPEPIQLNFSGTFLLLNTKIPGLTKEAVGKVSRLYLKNEAQVHLESLGLMVPLMREALELNDLEDVGRLMNQAHYHLGELQVSIPEIDTIVTRSIALGAIGAKLTGGGLGGAILVLTRDEKTAYDIAETLKDDIHSSAVMALT